MNVPLEVVEVLRQWVRKAEHEFVGPGLSDRIHRQPWPHWFELISGHGRGQFQVLLDYMCATGGYALSKQPARCLLPRAGLADQPLATCHSGHYGRTNGSLQIQHRIIRLRPKSLAQDVDFMQGLTT